jgi:hypothetical protein
MCTGTSGRSRMGVSHKQRSMETPSENQKSRCQRGKTMDNGSCQPHLTCLDTTQHETAKIPMSRPSARSVKLTCSHFVRLPTNTSVSSAIINQKGPPIHIYPPLSTSIHIILLHIYPHHSTSIHILPHLSTSVHIYYHLFTSI